MMRTFIKIIIETCLVFLLFVNSFGYAQGVNKKILNQYKTLLDSFDYAGRSVNAFTFDNKPQKIYSELTTFRGTSYRILFISPGTDAHILINIYDRDVKELYRKKVFDNSNLTENEYWIFEPEDNRTYYIEYTILPSPKADGKKGNIITVIGTKAKRAEPTNVYSTK
jgi:hypothetical protein